ncbi:MAG TPA: hypothetical protein DCX07_04630 [Phycisphaerales bacterium]|nr:hypothetical protein [Phycisphaerales bacterium]
MVDVHGHRAEFRFFRPGATKVYLAGDFNQWRGSELLMSPDGRGNWTAWLTLPAGDFRFRYVADGQWVPDYAAFGLEPGPLGPDSVVHVA